MQENIENNIILDEIESIEEIDFEGYVYDACCEDPHLYVTNDFISHNCVLWVDEIEKGLSGTKSSGQSDGGTTSRVVSTFLTWMQEKKSDVFIFATANDPEQIPTEFMRRFDEIFFVDLPNIKERKDIFRVLLKKYKRDPENFDIKTLSVATQNFSGAEIEKAIVSSMFECFSNSKKDLTTKDILSAIDNTNPIYMAKKEFVEDLRKWGKERCVPASLEYTISTEDGEDNIDIDLS